MRTRHLALPLGALTVMAVGGAHAPLAPADGPGGPPPARLAWPLGGPWVLTQPYGCTPFPLEPAAPWCPTGHFHSGIDMAAPEGTPVRSAAAGVARVSENPGGYGLYVLVEHGGGVATLYGHLAWSPLRGGEAVTAGQEVGEVGSSGLSTGPHLHFEVRRDARPVDPGPWLPAGR
jgi:murein DD-endopeptidase MepM/ murein hydrolase activator NlpD